MLLKEFLEDHPVSCFSIIANPQKEPLWVGSYASYLELSAADGFDSYDVFAFDLASPQAKIYVKEKC